MKRAAIYALILSMLAVPMFAQNPSVTKARCVSLEHISGGWRMAIDCDQGKGTITLTDQNWGACKSNCSSSPSTIASGKFAVSQGQLIVAFCGIYNVATTTPPLVTILMS